MARAFGMNTKVSSSSPPSGRDIFYIKIFDIFTRTYFHESKMNVADRTEVSFQMLAFLKKILA